MLITNTMETLKLCFILTAIFSLNATENLLNLSFHQILTPFQNCTVHLTRFLPSKNLTSLPIEYNPTTFFPVVWSSYELVTHEQYGFEYIRPLPNGNNSERAAFHFNPTLTKVTREDCFVDVNIIDFKVSTAKGSLYDMETEVVKGHYDMLIPWVKNRLGEIVDYYDGLQEEQSELSMPKYGVLHIIVAAQKTGSLVEISEFFRYVALVPLYSADGYSEHLKIFYLVGENLKTYTKLCCLQRQCSELYSLEIKQEIDQKAVFQKLNTDLQVIMEQIPSGFEVEHPQLTGDTLRKTQKNMTAILKNPRLIEFKKWMLSDLIILRVAFPNTSLEREAEADFIRLANVKFHTSNTLYMGVGQVGIQFITCDMLRRGSLSLIGYFSAFETRVWLALLGVVFVSLALLKVFDNVLEGEDIKVNVFDPVSYLLEQGTAMPQKPAKQIAAVAWITMGVVLSNSYKGQNITDLSAPLPPVPIEFFKQLLDRNFTIYSRQFNAPDEYIIDLTADFAFNVQMPTLLDEIKTEFRADWENSSIDKTVVEQVVKQYLNMSTYSHLLKLVENNLHIWSIGDILHKIMKQGVPEGYLRYVDKCHKSAYVSWSDEIEESVSILKRLVYDANFLKKKSADIKESVESVTTGKEILASAHKTWKVFKVVMQGEIAFKRIRALLESGIAKQWYEMEKRVKAYSDNIRLAHITAEPKKLELNDNIVVVFYAHSVLLFVSALAYFLEISSLSFHFKILTYIAKHMPQH